MSHLVVAADAVYVHRVAEVGSTFGLYYRGSVLPDDVATADAARLLDLGMVKRVADEPDKPAPAPAPTADFAAQLADVKASATQAVADSAATAKALQQTTAALTPGLSAAAQDRAQLNTRMGQREAVDVELRAALDSLAEQLSGITLQPGPPGADGADGRSAYEVWLAAGNTGSPADFLASLVGPAGRDATDGADGKSVELRLADDAIEWRQSGGVWARLVPLSAITGPPGVDGTNGVDGKSVELRIKGNNIEWRQEGSAWTTLVPFAAITGPAGEPGPAMSVGTGPPASSGRAGDLYVNAVTGDLWKFD